MKTLSIQVTYRKGRPLAAYIYLPRQAREKSARTEQISADLLVDYAADGRPIGMEVVTPEAVALEDIYAVFDRLGLGRPGEDELKPLQAA